MSHLNNEFNRYTSIGTVMHYIFILVIGNSFAAINFVVVFAIFALMVRKTLKKLEGINICFNLHFYSGQFP